MTRPHSLTRINPSHAFLIAGLFLSLLAVMFRPAGAIATPPTSVGVFQAFDSRTVTTVKVGKDFPNRTETYDVIPSGSKKPAKVELTGIPLIKLLESADVDTKDVQFVKIRLDGATNDSRIALVDLHPESVERPPMILSEGKMPGRGPLPTPSLIPGQPDPGTAIRQDDFYKLASKGSSATIIPGKPGATRLTVDVTSKQRKSGEYTLSASVKGGKKNASRSYQWFGFDPKGNPVELGSAEAIETKDATTGTTQRLVTVVVTEAGTGSTGSSFHEYTSRKKSKGTTKNVFRPTESTGSIGTGGGTGGGVAQNGVNGAGGISATPLPPSSTSTAPQTTPIPPASTTPTPATSAAAPSIDTTSITNAAQNVSGAGSLTTVSGVLLSSPTAAPAASAGGAAITALPAPVATELNSIFKPVNGAEDLWPYLLAVLFAFLFSGAVREWVNP